MWVDDAPQSFAARIYSWLLSLSRCVLTLLASVGHEINPSKQDIKKKRNSELHSNGAKAARHINRGIGGHRSNCISKHLKYAINPTSIISRNSTNN